MSTLSRLASAVASRLREERERTAARASDGSGASAYDGSDRSGAPAFAASSETLDTLSQRRLSGRVRRLVTVIALSAGSLLAFAPGSAQALLVHAFNFASAGTGAGQVESPQGVAIDQSTGDVYVVDAGNFRVDKFTPNLSTKTGNFDLAFGANVGGTGVNVCTSTCQAGTQGTSAGEFETPQFVAVDNSTGASAGDVYVGDPGDDTISKFDSSGNLITTWATGGQLSGAATFGSIDGITVDPNGNLLVINGSNAVYEFAQDGSAVTNFATTRGMTPAGLDVNAAFSTSASAGDLFKVNGDGSVEEVQSTGADVGTIDESNGTATGLTVDRSTGDLYEDVGSEVDHFQFNSSGQVVDAGGPCTVVPSGSCAPSDTFGTSILSAGTGIGYDSSETAAFVADAGNNDVAVFGPPSPGEPEIDGESASNVGSTYATLNALVNPFGIDTTCTFQYVSDADFMSSGYTDATTVACPSDLGMGYEDQAPSVDITGLTINTEYHFHVVAMNADGTVTGNDTTFTTLGPASIDSESSSNVLNTTATLNAQINPLGTDTSCTFQYVTDADFMSSGYTDATTVPCTPSDLGAGTSDVSASTNIIGLAVNTTYHFRAVATNSLGTETGSDQTFTTLGPASIDSESSSDVGNASATLNAQINPLGTDTTCVFQYVTDASFTSNGYTDATTVSCTPSDLGSGGSDVSASANITGLTAGTLYHFRAVATNSLGTETGSDQTFMTEPAALIDAESVSMVGVDHATVNAEVNPLGTDTSCVFEYVTDADFMSTGYADATTVACSPADLGSGSTDVSASARLTGLQSGTTYHFQVVATNVLGTVDGSVQIGDETFTTTAAPPSVDFEGVVNVTSSSATLKARINPNGGDTTYQFEVGTSTSYGGGMVPAVPVDVGSGTSDQAASVDLTGLAPDTTYHFRVVANPTSTGIALVDGSDQTFTTYAQIPPAGLPDSRAYELVTPTNTDGSELFSSEFIGGDQAATDGSAVAYVALSPFPGGAGPSINDLAVRTSTGWVSQPILPAQAPGVTLSLPGYVAFSSDLSKAILSNGGGTLSGGFDGQDDPPLVPGTCTGSVTPTTPCTGEALDVTNLFVRDNTDGTFQLVNSYANAPAGVTPQAASESGASADESTVVFSENAPLTTLAPTGVADLYAWQNGTVTLLGPGATLGGSGRVLGAVSASGSEIFFTDTNGNLNVFQNGSATQIDKGAGGGGQFMTALSDGSVAFFIDGGQLYAYGTAGSGTLTDLTGGQSGAGVQGVLGAGGTAADSLVYFVANGVLTSANNSQGQSAQAGADNLYVANDNGGTVALTFIATLSGSDGEDWNGEDTARVTPDGTHLAFDSTEPLTGFNNTDANTGGADDEIFLYSESSNSLVCASCNATRSLPVGSSQLDPIESGLLVGGNQYLPHNLSDDGSRLFFDSTDVLSPRATNGQQNVYEFENGQDYLISSGTSDANSSFFDASSSGDDVFFTTRDELVPQDQDDNYNLFDARVNGGFPAPSPAQPCAGDGCKPAATPAPPAATVATVTFFGPSNPIPPAPKAPKPKKKKKGKKAKIRLSAGAIRALRFTIDVRVPAKGSVTISGAGLKTITSAVRSGRTYRLTMGLTPTARSAVRAKRTLRIVVHVVYRSATGSSSIVALPVTVKA